MSHLDKKVLRSKVSSSWSVVTFSRVTCVLIQSRLKPGSGTVIPSPISDVQLVCLYWLISSSVKDDAASKRWIFSWVEMTSVISLFELNRCSERASHSSLLDRSSHSLTHRRPLGTLSPAWLISTRASFLETNTSRCSNCYAFGCYGELRCFDVVIVSTWQVPTVWSSFQYHRRNRIKCSFSMDRFLFLCCSLSCDSVKDKEVFFSFYY